MSPSPVVVTDVDILRPNSSSSERSLATVIDPNAEEPFRSPLRASSRFAGGDLSHPPFVRSAGYPACVTILATPIQPARRSVVPSRKKSASAGRRKLRIAIDVSNIPASRYTCKRYPRPELLQQYRIRWEPAWMHAGWGVTSQRSHAQLRVTARRFDDRGGACARAPAVGTRGREDASPRSGYEPRPDRDSVQGVCCGAP